jgi:hypothetical protein
MSTNDGDDQVGDCGAPLRTDAAGKARTGILLWLLGVPLPLILLFFLIKGCAT